MTGNSFENSETAAEKFSTNFSTNSSIKLSINSSINSSIKKSDLHRFMVFVAGGEHPLISFSNYQRAERLAIIFARLANARMEVFDSEKEVCYFVEPNEAWVPICSLKIQANENKK